MTGDGRRIDAREPHPWRCALVFVALPYLLLGVAWIFANPPSAAPDEQDHLVKALGVGSFQLGVPAEPLPADAEPSIATRGQSITRSYLIPSRFHLPNLHTCFAFQPAVTAACLPDDHIPPDVGEVEVGTPMGAYPPFLYAPIGWAALQAPTLYSAFVAGRLVVAILGAALLFLGAGHLFRWLGRRALLGLVVALTPMAIFTMGVLSTSGIEVAAGVAVACVAVVAAFRPDSVLSASTHWVLAAAGTTLALSRQLGVVALAMMILALLVFAGWSRIRTLLTTRRPSFWICVATLGAATLLMLTWEHVYDNPAFVEFTLTDYATRAFLDQSGITVEHAIGRFGYLDTTLPGAVVTLWAGMWGLLVGLGLILARRRDAAVLLAVFTTMVALAYYLYVSVFLTVDANIQGRYFLGPAAFVTILGATVVIERLSPKAPWAVGRLYLAVGVFVPAVQLFAVYWNARRYAVGSTGPTWFLPDAEWAPPGGFVPWLIVAALGAVILGVGTVTARGRVDAPPQQPEPAGPAQPSRI